jgi:capsular exopolysaccharide synthesis family protein
MPELPTLRPQRPTPQPVPARAAVPRYSTDQDHLLDRLAVVMRYRRIAVAVFALTAGAMMIQGYSQTPVYQAQARLLIEDERSTAMPGITNADNAYWQDPEPYYNTQYRILRGRDLTRRVVRRLNLQDVPEFNGKAAPPSGPTVLARQLARRAMALVRPAPPAPAEPPRPDETAAESALVGAFIARVQVVPVTGSRLVDVYFQSTDPGFASVAANALVDEYVAQNLELKQQSTQNMLEWLEKELSAQQRKVEESERALAEYRDRENALSLDDRNNIVFSRLTALNDALLKARTTRIEKDAVYSQVKSVTDLATAESIAIVSQNPQIQTLKLRQADLQRQKVQMGERYGDRHPEMVKVNASLADAQRQLDLETNRILQSVKNDYDRAVLEERTLASNLEQAKGDVQDLSRKSVAYNVMEREARSNRTVYEALLQREKELRVSSNSRSNNVRVVDHAEMPGGPVSPSGRRAWPMAVLVGLAAALAVAYGLDYLNDTIKTPEDVTKHLKLTSLGLIPSVRGDKHPILGSTHSPHEFGEAFRSLRTALSARYGDAGTRTMLVTSAQPLEGKTTTACNIAMALAYGGARVLLVDADMRRPGLHRPLRLSNDRGLSQVLTGQVRVRDVIQRTVDPNLLAITAGVPPPNPSELLASERMKTLLTNFLHGPFDWIVIDTPPVLAVTDAVVLAPMVSGVTFVVGSEMTRRRLAERALETLLASHPKSVGVVLNKVDFARNKYYYARYHGHQHQNYYAKAV